MPDFPIEKKARKRVSKKELVLPTDTEFRDQICVLYSSIQHLQTQLTALQADPYIAALPEMRDVRAQETKRIFASAVKVCQRNNVDTANLFSFMNRVIKTFGFCAVDSALKTAEALCKDGRPDGMIYDSARKYHEEFGNLDAAFLDATLFARSGQEYKEPQKTTSDENFVSKLASQYTDRAVKTLSRFEYYQMVRNFCISKPDQFDPGKVLAYFKNATAVDTEISQRIHGPLDVPKIDFESLKGE